MSGHHRDEVVDPDIAAGETALNWAMARGSGERIAARSRVQRRRKQHLRRVTAGSLAIVTLVTAGFLWPLRSVPPASVPARLPSSVLVVTPAKRVLPDGSVVELKDGATIDVSYSAAFRRVNLVQGQAYFSVTKNQAAPFIVIVGELEVRAVGTAFSVQMDARQVEVFVTEGRVAVSSENGKRKTEDSGLRAARSAGNSPTPVLRPVFSEILVDAGNRMVVEIATASAPPPVLAMSAAEQNEHLSWRVPRIELSGTPLSEALPVFNRYSPVPLSIADPSLGALELSGVLRPNNPNALLHVLKVEFGLETDRRVDGGIVLRRP